MRVSKFDRCYNLGGSERGPVILVSSKPLILSFAARMVGSTPTRFRHILLLFNVYRETRQQKAAIRDFWSGSCANSSAARTVPVMLEKFQVKMLGATVSSPLRPTLQNQETQQNQNA